jgi:hypothetical protein
MAESFLRIAHSDSILKASHSFMNTSWAFASLS